MARSMHSRPALVLVLLLGLSGAGAKTRRPPQCEDNVCYGVCGGGGDAGLGPCGGSGYSRKCCDSASTSTHLPSTGQKACQCRMNACAERPCGSDGSSWRPPAPPPEPPPPPPPPPAPPPSAANGPGEQHGGSDPPAPVADGLVLGLVLLVGSLLATCVAKMLARRQPKGGSSDRSTRRSQQRPSEEEGDALLVGRSDSSKLQGGIL